jgi:hypothetical protein
LKTGFLRGVTGLAVDMAGARLVSLTQFAIADAWI